MRSFYGISSNSTGHRLKTEAPEANRARRQVLQSMKEGDSERLRQSADLWLNSLEGLRLDLLRRECEKLLTLLEESLAGERPEAQPADSGRDWAADIANKRTWSELRAWLLDTLAEWGLPERRARVDSRAVSWEEVIRLLKGESGPDWSLEEAAARAGVHPVTFSRLFKRRFGVNFVRYMVDRRMHKAGLLLQDRSYSVAAVAAAVGYADLRHFNRLFKRAFGMTPGEYRRQQHADPERLK